MNNFIVFLLLYAQNFSLYNGTSNHLNELKRNFFSDFIKGLHDIYIHTYIYRVVKRKTQSSPVFIAST